jgi:hypothetical protein
MSHRCPARGCGTVVDDSKLMYRPDWYRVPRPLRNAVLRAYAGGAGLGSEALRHAQDLAIRAVSREPEPGDAP